MLLFFPTTVMLNKMLLLVSHSPTLHCGDALDLQNTQIDDVEVNHPSRKAQKDVVVFLKVCQ